MDFSEVARTTFSAREFVDEPLPDELLFRILDSARFAPSGGNRQGWRVIVVRDIETRRKLADICNPVVKEYVAQARVGESPFNTVSPTKVTAADVANAKPGYKLFDTMQDIHRVPVVLVVAVNLFDIASFDAELKRVGVVSGASIYPFVWSILLAARNEGYAGVMTTFISRQEQKAQDLLNLPLEYAVAALIALGKPVKQLTKLTRKPVSEFTTIDRFDGDMFDVS